MLMFRETTSLHLFRPHNSSLEQDKGLQRSYMVKQLRDKKHKMASNCSSCLHSFTYLKLLNCDSHVIKHCAQLRL